MHTNCPPQNIWKYKKQFLVKSEEKVRSHNHVSVTYDTRLHYGQLALIYQWTYIGKVVSEKSPRLDYAHYGVWKTFFIFTANCIVFFLLFCSNGNGALVHAVAISFIFLWIMSIPFLAMILCARCAPFEKYLSIL